MQATVDQWSHHARDIYLHVITKLTDEITDIKNVENKLQKYLDDFYGVRSIRAPVMTRLLHLAWRDGLVRETIKSVTTIMLSVSRAKYLPKDLAANAPLAFIRMLTSEETALKKHLGFVENATR